MIYSEYLDCMIPSGFTTAKVYFSNNGITKCKSSHWSWCEEDCVYYSDTVDGAYYNEIPINGIKTLSLRLGQRCRLLVKIDK